MSNQVYSEEQLEKAKQMYMQYKPMTEIAKALDINYKTVQYHATKKDKCWRLERELSKADLLSQVSESKRGAFASMTLDSITVVQKCLATLARSESITTTDAKKAMEILESLDRITRLDDGAPTEIVAEKPMALETIHTIVASDPFELPAPEATEDDEETEQPE